MPTEATQILNAISASDRTDRLIELVYDDFRRLARKYVGDTSRTSLQPNAVVHEAFIKLVDNQHVDWTRGAQHLTSPCDCEKSRIVKNNFD